MSDLTADLIAADLVDFLTVAYAEIDDGCGFTINRIYRTAGRPAVECPSIAVWVDSIDPTLGGNAPADPTQNVCAYGTSVAVAWRLAACTTMQEKPLSVAQHQADATCFNVLTFGLYRRVLIGVGDGDVFTSVDQSCTVTGAGGLDVETRQGGTITATQLLRVSVPLVRP